MGEETLAQKAAEETQPRLKVSLDMDDLTFGELELFEDVTGMVLSDAYKTEIVRDPKTGLPVPDPDDEKGRPLKEVKTSAKAMMGMVFLALRRQKPDLTFDDVRALRMSDVDFGVQEGEEHELDPTPPTEPVDAPQSEQPANAG